MWTLKTRRDERIEIRCFKRTAVSLEPLLEEGWRILRRCQGDNERGGSNKSPAGWALDWLWSQPEVSVVLSGMSTMRQVEENIALADRSEIGKLGKSELDVIERVRKKYSERAAIPCTGCGYCVPCPNNVAIPRNFQIYNDAVIHDDLDGAGITYNNFFNKENRASNCVKCGACEEKCPQGIKIMDWLEKVDKALSK